ncbi:MAG: HDIG domain-containing protein [Ignavibacteriae bacterium]|nr:HDIG domain-containing protein [Ignavibacteriota bacterium]
MAEENRKFELFKTVRRVHIPRDVAYKAAIVLPLIVLLGLMFPKGEAIELDYKVGAVWAQKDLIAPFSFPIYRDEREYQMEVEDAKKKVYPVFERDVQVADTQLKRIDTFFQRLSGAAKLRSRYLKSTTKHLSSAYKDSLLFEEAAAQLPLSFSEDEWEILSALAPADRLNDLHELTRRSISEFLGAGIIDRGKGSFSRQEIALRKGTVEEIIPLTRLHDMNEVAFELEGEFLAHFGGDSGTSAVALKIALHHVTPNIRFNKSAAELAAVTAVEAVPRTMGFVQENERIVSKHERITPETKLKLDSLRRAKAERGAATAGPSQLLGICLHVTIVITLYGIYLYLFRKGIFSNNRRLTLIAFLILLEGFFAYLTYQLNVVAPIEYLIFVPTASMLLTILFDSRVGFYGTVTIAFLIAGVRGNDYSIALASLVAGALSVYTVRDVKNRTQIFRSLGFIFLGYAITIVALALERFESMGVVFEQIIFALANATISPVLTYGLLIFFERVFKVTTDLTLIELSHFNHPLLRLLGERAPGTYHHSMTMAGLAEAAAAAVGANEVLARVGACFHDIGKIEKPTYFVENQKGSRNRHDRLSPRMSSLIIANHVKEGIALAREYKLPEEVIEFIPMHHGTTRIEYFYRKALKLAETSDDPTKVDEINEQDYRYPGPKPQTKETGIMMLADAIEATARTLDDPSPQKLEVAIDELIKKRFEEGELDECPLTLKDLTKIKAAFLGVLVGIYHARIKYPEAEQKKSPTMGKPEAETAEKQMAHPDRLSRTIKEIDKG